MSDDDAQLMPPSRLVTVSLRRDSLRYTRPALLGRSTDGPSCWHSGRGSGRPDRTDGGNTEACRRGF
jgi:hypothetical protein